MGDGIHSLTLDIYGYGPNGLQGIINGPATLATPANSIITISSNPAAAAWDAGANTSGGTLSPRPSGQGNDLLGIVAAHADGVQSDTPFEQVAYGTFTVNHFVDFRDGALITRWSLTAFGAS